MPYRNEQKAQKTQWLKIAGRGTLGDHNWGASFDTPKEELEKQRQELLTHLGEQVLLSGGGGPGYEIVTLLGVPPIEMNTWKEHGKDGKECEAQHAQLRVRLAGSSFGGGNYEDRYDPKYGYVHAMPTHLLFEPFLDSWQISVKVK